MSYELKTISASGIAEAISKAELYRYLNEPEETESICHDILAIEPGHQVALRMLGMAITDQFNGSTGDRFAEAEKVLRRLTDRYEQLYYLGIVHERRAKALLRAGRAPHTLLPFFEEAMRCFSQAGDIRPKGNDDAILRWNRCVRILQSNPDFAADREMASYEAHDSPPA
jgi:tetratricopeptide (TPR) repeat protein